MGGHQSASALKDEWLTPPEIIRALGPFDLDPCAPVVRPWDTAYKHYTIHDDGLVQQWSGRVWCNPPYGAQTGQWLAKCAEHGNAIALIFARTETASFQKHVFGKAYGIQFLAGRLHFHHSDGRRANANAGAPSVLIAYDSRSFARLVDSGLEGPLISGWRVNA